MVAALLTTSTLMNRARVDGLHCPAVANSPPQVTAVNLQTAHTPKKARGPARPMVSLNPKIGSMPLRVGQISLAYKMNCLTADSTRLVALSVLLQYQFIIRVKIYQYFCS